MSQQYPNQPPYHTPAYAPPQPPPQKKKSKKWLYIGVGAAVFVIIIAAASSNGSKGDTDTASAPAHSASASDPKKSPKAPSQSPAQAFKAYAAKNGSAAELAAVKHVTKIQGADGNNDILDSADVYTDYTGDLMSGNAGNGKLIASAFADWQKSRGKASDNGLVTVYNSKGDLLSNGKY
jgi:hypothetical protein